MVTNHISQVNPNVSVVIPLFNKAPYIARAINSVLAQTHQAFEIVVVDDGSTDDSLSIVEKIRDDRVRLVRKENGGVSSARNHGIQEAKTDLIAFLDADDVYKPDFLERIMYMYHEYPEAGGYATNFEIAGEDGSVRVGVKALRKEHTVLDFSGFLKHRIVERPVTSSTVAVKRAAFERVGAFPPGVKLGEDLDTWIRIASEYPIVFDCEVGATYSENTIGRACEINSPERRPVFFDTLDRLATQKMFSRNTLNDINEFKNVFTRIYAVWQIKHASAREGRRALLNMNTRIFLFYKLEWLALSFIPRVFLSKVEYVRECIARLVAAWKKGWR